MIPKGREAEFYSFYEVSERGTSWTGPLIFGLANQLFGSLRYGILALIFYFIAGLIDPPVCECQEGNGGCKEAFEQ